ncbi:MAG: hypothetical protein KJN90_12560 [Gammaproteobacteria bacterium]|nr:hypothetical protein [Gammaproteobacteria bacterium]
MNNKQILKLAGLLSVVSSMLLMPLAQAQDYVWAPELPVGSSIPAIEAPDQNGATKTFSDLVGENGLLLMFSRSFDW